jgi:hypothetical protein
MHQSVSQDHHDHSLLSKDGKSKKDDRKWIQHGILKKLLLKNNEIFT